MSDLANWAFPESMQPSQRQVSFDLAAALDAVVQVHAVIPDGAFTTPILGNERIGNGVVIGEDGLVLTIGYLITEAETIWLTTNSGAVLPATVLAYDFATGFGLVFPLGKLNAPVMQRGSAKTVSVGDDVIFIGHGGRSHTLNASIVDKREFAGYWEYVLDEAIFTAPAHPQWGGAALVGQDGLLLGIGSLVVDDAAPGKPTQGNMIVPIDLLEPVLDDLLTRGRSPLPPRPWLGMYTAESEGQLVVANVAPMGPAERAGVIPGDFVTEVDGARPASLADLFRRIWHVGPAGVDIPLTLMRDGKLLRANVRSADRSDFLYKPKMH